MDEAARQCAAMMDAMHGMHGMHGGMMSMRDMGDMGGMGGMVLFGLLWLLIVAAVAALLIFGGIWLWRRGQPSGRTIAPPAREMLDRRYAAGDLDRETYLRMRADLEASG